MNDYTLGIKELDSAMGGIKKGSNIMLIGPHMSGKDAILHKIIYHSAAKNENAIILLTTGRSADHILAGFKENNMSLPLPRIGIVDCITRTSGSIEIESDNNRHFIRAAGFSSKPTPYFEYEIEGFNVSILGRK